MVILGNSLSINTCSVNKEIVMKTEKLCNIGLIAGVIGILLSLLVCAGGATQVAGAGCLCASAIVIGSSLIALAISQRTKQE
jgi:hypothetical protein